MRRAGLFAAFTGVIGFLIGLVAAGTRPAGPTNPIPVRPASAQVAGTNLGAPPAPGTSAIGAAVNFAPVAARVNAAVVSIEAAVRGDDRARPTPRYRAGDDPFGPREGSGSGFIIDPTGVILTNFHVVEGADRITATMVDGRVLTAKVIGVDPAIDIALLQVPAREPLPVISFGNSDDLRVGEWVCAIGNPLNYVHSVTVGVVSFLGRKIFDPSLDAFIQTDAAISFGNSGGPLIDANGRVVGITTAISAQASNIGFAIPINQVVSVLPQLREHGRVSRGYIGVGLAALTPVLQQALRLGPSRGALVQNVSPDTPAERAGLRTYDVITAADGRAIKSDEELIRYISSRAPGVPASLEVWRDGGVRSLTVKLTERPPVESARSREGRNNRAVRPATGRLQGPLGFTVRDLDQATVARQVLPASMEGVQVIDVDPAGPARLARIRAGHIILEVNRRRVASAAEFQTVVNGLKPGEVAAILLYDQLADQRVIVAIVIDPPS
jgi:serine protease Do